MVADGGIGDDETVVDAEVRIVRHAVVESGPDATCAGVTDKVLDNVVLVRRLLDPVAIREPNLRQRGLRRPRHKACVEEREREREKVSARGGM